MAAATRQRKKAGGETDATAATTVSAPVPITSQPQPDSLKDIGNRYYASGNYVRAAECFTMAIEGITLSAGAPSAQDAKQLHLLYSNRSATYNANKNYQAALEDAERCIQIEPNWAKGYFRKGAALEGLLLFHEAYSAYQSGLTLEPNDPLLKKAVGDLDALLKELKLTESQLSKCANPDSDRFELMVKWLKAGGAKFPRLYLQYYSEDYRGVHCLSNIPAEEIILYVPHHMIMTSQVAMESPIGKQMVDAQLELRSKHSYLAAYLLQERAKGVDSYWQPYIASLPQVYSNMPIFFDQAMLKHLKGSFTLDKIKDRIESLKAEYLNICEHVPAMKQFTHDDFVWARLVVITRIFGLQVRGVKTDGLVAYADMLNHKKPKDAHDTDTRWSEAAFDDNQNGFTITSVRSIPRGEQVYDSYGRKCNSRFFVNYGFALDDNDDDNEALLRFIPPATFTAANLSVKSRLCGGRNLLAPKEFQIPATYRETTERERKTKDMFGYLRFLLATDTELIRMNAHEGMKIEEIEPLTTRLEIEVLKLVQQMARASLAAFDHTLEEDNALLAANNFPNSNVRNCVLQRRGEKQVLRWYDLLASKAIPALGMKWQDLKKQAGKYLSQSARDHYMTHVVAVLVKRGA